MRRRQQLQKLDAEQLRWTEVGMPSLPWLTGKKVIDKTIIPVWGKQFSTKQSYPFAAVVSCQEDYLKNQPRPPTVKSTIF